MMSFKLIFGFLFASLITTVVVLGVVAYRNDQDAVIASAWVRHTHRVIEKAETIALAYKDAQLDINRMIIENDTVGKSACFRMLKGLLGQLSELQQMTHDNREQQLNIDSAVVGLSNFIEASDRILTSVGDKSGSEDDVHGYAEMTPLYSRVVNHLSKIEAAEVILLAKREATDRVSVEAFFQAFVWLLGAIGSLLVVTFFVVRYNFNKRKRAETKMLEALEGEIELNKLKSNFVTLASHEFRTPLTTILSSTFLLEKYSFGPDQEKARKHIARIKASVNNLTSILDEFLSLTKIEEGGVRPAIERTNLPEFVRSICSNLQAVAKPGQTIVYIHSGETEIETDPVLIGNILSNLIGNSIKYSGENSAIHVTSKVNSSVHLAVKDCGIGIPETDQKHLFERFYRASNAGAIQGTGLGLHIMRHYVQMLNGSVNVQSEVGKGTEVTVTFDRN